MFKKIKDWVYYDTDLLANLLAAYWEVKPLSSFGCGHRDLIDQVEQHLRKEGYVYDNDSNRWERKA